MAASILFLISDRSTCSGGTYTRSFMNPTGRNHIVSDRVSVGAKRNESFVILSFVANPAVGYSNIQPISLTAEETFGRSRQQRKLFELLFHFMY